MTDLDTNKFSNSLSNIPTDINIHYQKLYNYIELVSQGSSFLLRNNFNEALEAYEKAFRISEILGDEYKKNESKCNIGISNFFLGKFINAINNIQPCFDYIYFFCSKEVGSNNIKNLYLLCKSGLNLCMCKLTINNDYNNCISIIENIVNIISKEADFNKQLFSLRYLNKSLFKVNSLVKYNNNDINNNSIYDNNFNESNIEFLNGNKSQYNDINKSFIDSFNNFIATRNFDTWINSLNLIYQKMKQLNDNAGLIHIQFNLQMAICLKNNNNNDKLNNEEIYEAKVNLFNLLKEISKENNDIYNNMIYYNNNPENLQLDEELINNIIEDYKSKIFVIGKIYQILYSIEEKIISNIGQNNYINNSNHYNNFPFYNYKEPYFVFNIKSEFYLKLFFKYTIKYFNENIQDMKLKNDLIQEINNTLDLINSKKIDISKIDLSSLDKDISTSLALLLNDLFKIYRKNKLKNYFKEFQNYSLSQNIDSSNLISNKENSNNSKKDEDEDKDNQSIGISQNQPTFFKEKKDENKKFERFDSQKYFTSLESSEGKLNIFFEKQYSHICKGNYIKKMNFTSSGYKEYFYKVDWEKDKLKSYNTNNSKKSKKKFDFDNILKVVIGLKTKNIINKSKILKKEKRNKPYHFMSLFLEKRTIDFYFDDEKNAQKWFYGLFRYFKISEREFKIGSCTKYILFRIKCKMINKLGVKISLVNNNDITFAQCLLDYVKKNKEDEK